MNNQSSASNLPFVSYAQNYEDVMLWRALRNVKVGFYIDVGAQSPESDSVTKAFSLLGWRGVNIEPHPTYFDQLRQLRPQDVNLDVAIGEKSGSITMNFVDESGLSTADKEIASRHVAAGYTIRMQEVKMVTLADVWHMHVPYAQEVHFLKVDVEGLECAVLSGNDWKGNRPWIVLVEATLPNSQIENYDAWESILLDARYQFVYADGLNRYYVARERPELATVFRYPPNVFDSFITIAQESAQQELTVLRQQISALNAALVAATAASKQQIVDLHAGHAASTATAIESAHRELSALQQHIVELHAEHVRVSAEMEQGLHESRVRIEYGEQSLMLARQRELDVQDRLDFELTSLRNEINQRDDMLRHASLQIETSAQRQVDMLRQVIHRAEVAEQQRDAIVRSTWWRLTAPSRVLLGSIPMSLRRRVRRFAKAVWWIVTPWCMPARLRHIRARDRR